MLVGLLEVKPGSAASYRGRWRCRARRFCVDDNDSGQNNGNSGVYLQRRYESRSELRRRTGANLRCDLQDEGPDYNVARPAAVADVRHLLSRAAVERAENAVGEHYRLHNGTRVQDHVVVPSSTGAGSQKAADGRCCARHGSKNKFRNI